MIERLEIMKDYYYGLDFLRGLGIFILVGLHSAFYYFGGLYELDLNNPTPIITVIGLFLMFAGMFAIISGMVHNIQMMIYLRSGKENILFRFVIRGITILVFAYLYFIFTGPGVVNMAEKSMDNSILVEFIQSGTFTGFSFQRVFYIDSLVMLGLNIILLGLFSALMIKILKTANNVWFSRSYFIAGIATTLLSIVRIPLYSILIKALDDGNYLVYFLLNWLVNKNNPILPYIAFGLFGMWIGSSLTLYGWKKTKPKVLVTSLILFIAGVLMYILLPDTMLERSIDMKWYSIILAQLGLFMLLVLGALKLFDFSKNSALKNNFLIKFITRFGVAGLTVFFLESILSAIVFRIIKNINPEISLTMAQALTYGFSLSIFWGILLIFWEKTGYKYGLEYIYGKIASLSGRSTKLEKLNAGRGEA